MKSRDWLQLVPAAIIVRITYYISRFLTLGEGSNLPGKIILQLFPSLLLSLVPRFKNGWIVVTGTNGKTTTTKILVELMEQYGFSVVTNSRGANLLSGILTSILLSDHLANPFIADWAVFEIDEAVLAKSFDLFRPHLLVVTNFSRDQLDRYGEVDSNVNKMIQLLRDSRHQCQVILNGNDPNSVRIGSVVAPERRFYFGLKDAPSSPESGFLVEKEIGETQEFAFEPPELNLWAESIRTDLNGSRFTLRYARETRELSSGLPGLFNILNILAAAAVCYTEVDPGLARLPGVLNQVKPCYGRSECLEYKGKPVFLFLVKNPVGFNHILQLLTQSPSDKRIMLVLNDLTADGKDISWTWDVALENLRTIPRIKEVVTSGTRAGDMALRVKYSNQPSLPLTVEYHPQRAFKELAHRLQAGEELFILANYTSMLKLRPYLLRSGCSG
jgi:lipid II isoglutaminyl synthase (glutamine-hydrolysing)